MDYVDAPYATLKERKERPKNNFQLELKNTIKERKKRGLTHEVTSEESEGNIPDDDYDSEEENSFTMNYRKKQFQRPDRPTSAKHRTKPDLGETLRDGEAQKWMKTQNKIDHKTSLHSTSPILDQSPRLIKQTSQSEIDKLLGISPKSRASPLDERLTTKQSFTVDEGLLPKARTSPVQSSSLPKTFLGDKKSPKPSAPWTKEETIFGKKAPTEETENELVNEKDWKAPNFRKSPVDAGRSSPSLGSIPGLGGRKTPTDAVGRRTPSDVGLQAISESPKPKPRLKPDNSPNPVDTQMKMRESPRPLNLDSPKDDLKNKKPKVDIFGGKKEIKEDKDEIPTASQRRFMKENRSKTPTSKQVLFGRTTPPTGQTTPPPGQTTPPTGRTTPTGRETPKTSTGKQTKFDLQGSSQKEDKKPKKEPGLFDFLMDDSPKVKNKNEIPKNQVKEEKNADVIRKPMLKKSMSHDSISEEFLEHPSLLDKSTVGAELKDIQSDQSSVCLEFDNDPDKQKEKLKELKKQNNSGTQRNDHKEADDIIFQVENTQTDPKMITEKRPASTRTQTKVYRPKPRHSLPGSCASSTATSDQSSDMFNSTMSIRQAIYEQWKNEKLVELKQKTLEEKKKQEEIVKKKLKDIEDKKLESQASYAAWMKQKEQTFVKEKKKQMIEEEKKKHKKKEEESQKKENALKDFVKWKEEKDKYLIEEHKKKIEEKHKKKQEQRSVKTAKETDNETAFIRWKERKDKKIIENHKQMTETKIKTKKIIEQTQQQKEQEATKEYNEWLRRKEEQESRESNLKKQKKLQEVYGEYDFKPPWSPASKTIPCGR